MDYRNLKSIILWIFATSIVVADASAGLAKSDADRQFDEGMQAFSAFGQGIIFWMWMFLAVACCCCVVTPIIAFVACGFSIVAFVRSNEEPRVRRMPPVGVPHGTNQAQDAPPIADIV